MLNATINGKLLKDYLDSISAIASECRFHVNENKIYTTIVDAAGVAMVKSTLNKGVFTNYTATPCEFGLNLARIKSSIMAFNAKEYEITFSESTTKFDVIGGRDKFTTRVFASETIKKDPPKDPNDFILPSHIVVDGEDLALSLKKITSLCDDKIVIEHKKDTKDVNIYSLEDIDSAQTSIPTEKVSIIKDDTVRSIFSSDYLKSILPMFSRSKTVDIHIGVDMPIRFNLLINDAIETIYIIAPRIEN